MDINPAKTLTIEFVLVKCIQYFRMFGNLDLRKSNQQIEDFLPIMKITAS